MKLNLIFFIFILIVQNLFGQSKEVCNEILQKEVSLGGLNDNLEDFVSDFQTMVLCEFDSIDAQIFLGQIEYMSIITTYVLSHQLNANRENESLSFNDLKELMKEELRKPGYREVREMVVASNEIIQRVAHISEWDTHRELLIKMGMTQPQLDDIYAIVKANESSMYSEIFLIYSDTLSHRQQRELTEKARND